MERISSMFASGELPETRKEQSGMPKRVDWVLPAWRPFRSFDQFGPEEVAACSGARLPQFSSWSSRCRGFLCPRLVFDHSSTKPGPSARGLNTYTLRVLNSLLTVLTRRFRIMFGQLGRATAGRSSRTCQECGGARVLPKSERPMPQQCAWMERMTLLVTPYDLGWRISLHESFCSSNCLCCRAHPVRPVASTLPCFLCCNRATGKLQRYVMEQMISELSIQGQGLKKSLASNAHPAQITAHQVLFGADFAGPAPQRGIFLLWWLKGPPKGARTSGSGVEKRSSSHDVGGRPRLRQPSLPSWKSEIFVEVLLDQGIDHRHGCEEGHDSQAGVGSAAMRKRLLLCFGGFFPSFFELRPHPHFGCTPKHHRGGIPLPPVEHSSGPPRDEFLRAPRDQRSGLTTSSGRSPTGNPTSRGAERRPTT